MKFIVFSAISLSLANIALAQWACDRGYQCGHTIIHRDDSDFWIQNLKNAETAAGREDQDPLWDLFYCNGERGVTFVNHCPGKCSYTGTPGGDICAPVDEE